MLRILSRRKAPETRIIQFVEIRNARIGGVIGGWPGHKPPRRLWVLNPRSLRVGLLTFSDHFNPTISTSPAVSNSRLLFLRRAILICPTLSSSALTTGRFATLECICKRSGAPCLGFVIPSVRGWTRFDRQWARRTSTKHREPRQQIRNCSRSRTPVHQHRSRRRSPGTPREPASCRHALRHYRDSAKPIARSRFALDLSKTLGPALANRLHGSFLSLWSLPSFSRSRRRSCLSPTSRSSGHRLPRHRLPAPHHRRPRNHTGPLFSP